MIFKSGFILSKYCSFGIVFIVLYFCSSCVNGKSSLGSFVPTFSLDTHSISSSQDSQILAVESDDILLLSTRDLSPDLLASAVPVSSRPPKSKAKPDPENRNLHLRSSLKNVDGISGFTLYSLPIISSELFGLLTDTRDDLQKHDADSKTRFYQFDSAKWSFLIITANVAISHVYIQAVVSHFARLLPKPHSPDEIVSTRVGLILNDSTPIADVMIMPRPNTAKNHSYIPFSNFNVPGKRGGGNNSSTSPTEPIEVTTVTPTGSSCSYQLVNESAILAPYSTAPDHQNKETHNKGLQPRLPPLDPTILAHITQTLFAISLRLWHAQDGIPRRTLLPLASAAVASLALLQIALPPLKRALLADFRIDNSTSALVEEIARVDTGWFEMGRLTARLVMEVRAQRGGMEGVVVLGLKTWVRLLTWFLTRPGLDEMMTTWAMQGEIFGPRGGDRDRDYGGGKGNGSDEWPVVLGRWELVFGDDYDF